MSGGALAAAVLALAVATTLSAALAELSRSAMLLARARLSAARALLAADQCLAHAVARLPAGWDFDALLAGPDGVVGTGDDATVGAPAGCQITLARPPGPPVPPRILAQVEAAVGRGRRLLRALIRRETSPGPPALLWLAERAVPGPVEGTLILDAEETTTSEWPPLAAIASPDDLVALDTWLASGNITVAPADAAPRYAPEPPLAELTGRAQGGPALPPSLGLVGSGAPPLALTLAEGDLQIASPARGSGLLVVPGFLDIQAPFDFTGVVVAAGGLWLEPGATLDIRGALWLGRPADGGSALRIDGTAVIRADRASLDLADGLLALPRLARLAGIQDG